MSAATPAGEGPAADPLDAVCCRNTRLSSLAGRSSERAGVFGIAVTSLLLAACGREPGWNPIPQQQSLDLGSDPSGVGPAVKMEDPDANDYIVRDIGLMPDIWRWAFLHPELRFRVAHAEGLRFTAELNIPEVTFKVTGPVVVAYFVDGRRLGFTRCDHPGNFTIDQAVPPKWLVPGKYVHVTFDADRRWVSPDDGAQLSFLLFRAGFTE